ncbi:MAG TPA: ribonuclease III [Rhodanobacteraceae bacterium]|nr:ribonuclease III [Rhodanobacteraceae bacterium]
MATDAPAALGHAFSDPALLAQALTHRSAGQRNNERLEFLGDALVNCIVAELVYEQHPRADEGEMTRLRAALVNGNALAAIARAAEIGDRLHLGPGELKSGGFRRDSILADAFEAVVAAVYLDAGWETCRSVVRALFEERSAAGVGAAQKDAKTQLQERLQARALALPSYELVASHGDDHAKTFDVECRIDALGIRAHGSGSTRRGAEQAAAERALAALAEAADG